MRQGTVALRFMHV